MNDWLKAVVSVVETLVDRTVALPCKAILHPPHDDTPNLLLFYRHPSNIPFFRCGFLSRVLRAVVQTLAIDFVPVSEINVEFNEPKTGQ
ncbi:hypothetical protein O3P69_017146 [Scylla paramamosain]|uniref:Uncharacterized protein n=1 Tax=Scylla paramamosain TaxID=85552 RepID=A0AAW0TUY4_SCYPA